MGVPLVEVMAELIDLSEGLLRHPVRYIVMYLPVPGGAVLVFTSTPTTSPNEGGITVTPPPTILGFPG